VGQITNVTSRVPALKGLSGFSYGATSLLELKLFCKTFGKNGSNGVFVIIHVNFVRVTTHNFG